MSIKTVFAKAGRKVVEHAPTIMMYAGLGLGTAATIVACYKTDDFKKIKAKAEADHETINECLERGFSYDDRNFENEYGEAEAKHDRQVVTKDIILGFGKTYWLPLTMGISASALIISSHGIIMKRNAALSMGLTMVSQAFKHYREQVIGEYGEEVDHKFLFERKDYEHFTTTDDDGNVIESGTGAVIQTYPESPYTFTFDKTNRYWQNDETYNIEFLINCQRELNRLLTRRGWVTLNDFCDCLGFKKTSLGQRVGWVKGKHAAEEADQKIDFHFVELNAARMDPVQGRHRTMTEGYYIIANVDGTIDYLIDAIEEEGI